MHIKHFMDLPLHHRDPFDRMLVPQAIVEQLTIVTADSVIPRYDVITVIPNGDISVYAPEKIIRVLNAI
jgi:PIN domain nuclease of toxin-antitoxin system